MQHLGEFESIEFRGAKNIVLVPLKPVLTLHDDMFGTSATENQVKSLSSRKADIEGHTADYITGEDFSVTSDLRFWRSVNKLVEAAKSPFGWQKAEGGLRLT